MVRSRFFCVMWSLGTFGCAPAPEISAVAEQALADGRASLAVFAVEVPPTPPSLRQPTRMQPLRSEGMPTTGEARIASFVPAAGMPNHAAALSGSPPERILAWLGEPALRRAEGPVAIWLYSTFHSGMPTRRDILSGHGWSARGLCAGPRRRLRPAHGGGLPAGSGGSGAASGQPRLTAWRDGRRRWPARLGALRPWFAGRC